MTATTVSRIDEAKKKNPDIDGLIPVIPIYRSIDVMLVTADIAAHLGLAYLSMGIPSIFKLIPLGMIGASLFSNLNPPVGHKVIGIANVGRAALRLVKPAIQYTPWWYRIRTKHVEIHQRQFPGDPQEVFRGTIHEFDALPPERRKVWITRYGVEKEVPLKLAKRVLIKGITDDASSKDVYVIVTWSIQFMISNILQWEAFIEGKKTTEEAAIELAFQALEDTSAKTIDEELGVRTLQEIRKDLKSINIKIRDDLIEQTKLMGIEIGESALQSPDTGPTYAEAAIAADAKRRELEGTKYTIEGEGLRIERLGAAEGKAAKDRYTGEGEGMAAMAAKLGMTGREVAELQTTEDIFKADKGQNTFVLGPILEAVKGFLNKKG